jgi:hypothetical protein
VSGILYAYQNAGRLGMNGSGVVFLSCIEALKRDHFVRTLCFGDDRSAGDMVMPGPSHSKLLKLARAAARGYTGKLIAPRALEELGRGIIKDQIRQFIKVHRFGVLLLNKFDTIGLIGQDVVSEFRGTKLLDLHDDFIEREVIERQSLAQLMRNHPQLRGYSPYASLFRKHKVSRLDERAARQQEAAVLKQFDRILVASEREADIYRKRYGSRVMWCPWPIMPASVGRRDSGFNKAGISFDAGFIASDAVFNLEGLLSFVHLQLPLIQRKKPSFSFAVAGGICEAFAMACPDFAKRGIGLLGRVAKVSDFYGAVATVYVPLLNGTGVSLKTLEAVAHGVPVLSTATGVRGLSKDRLANVRVIDFAQFAEFCDAAIGNGSAAPSYDDEAYLKRIDQAIG